MPLIQRKRRAEPDDEEESPDGSPAPATQRRRQSASPEEDAYNGDSGTQADSSLDQMVKKLVRLALASEYQRRPIRRADISEKVLGSQGRQFKRVFDQAQMDLRSVFGMEMIELPAKEKVTLQQRRAAAKTDKPNKTTASWVLATILPSTFHHPEILPPSAIPTDGEEGKYTGIYSVVVALISLSGSSLNDSKLDRYMKRARLDDATTVEGYEKPFMLFKRMERDGYIVRVKETGPSGEEDISWIVGPRGKVEIGDDGVRGLTRTVYGHPEGADGEDIDRRIARSLGVGDRPQHRIRQAEGGAEKKKRGRPGRGAQNDDENDEDEDEDDGSDDE